MLENPVMFIPACGFGLRTSALGQHKPFLDLPDTRLALDVVMKMSPGWPIEIALRREQGCPQLSFESTVHFFERTASQADTISRWLDRQFIKRYVLISNCDNAIDAMSIRTAARVMEDQPQTNGIVFTFKPVKLIDDRFSYVKSDADRLITDIVEHKTISQQACAGVYLLKISALDYALKETDLYLSQALARMPQLYAMPVASYIAWNDPEQYAELAAGEKQFA